MKQIQELFKRIDKLEEEVLRLSKLIKKQGASSGKSNKKSTNTKRNDGDGVRDIESAREEVRAKYRREYGRSNS